MMHLHRGWRLFFNLLRQSEQLEECLIHLDKFGKMVHLSKQIQSTTLKNGR
jgi:hypothetical protein